MTTATPADTTNSTHLTLDGIRVIKLSIMSRDQRDVRNAVYARAAEGRGRTNIMEQFPGEEVRIGVENLRDLLDLAFRAGVASAH